MPWPLSQDYNEAIQTPAQCFLAPDLRRGVAVTNTQGMPVPCSGNFADVYAVVFGQRKWAVKCFTRQIPGLRERYIEISKFLKQVPLPFMVEFEFLEQGIRVRNEWYPIVKMNWVEGVPLNTYVHSQLDSPQTLDTLSRTWVRLAARLRKANLAHGDLQHGNVLLIPGTKAGTFRVRLVDYDGMCVPALDLLKSTEEGHSAYQHPQKVAGRQLWTGYRPLLAPRHLHGPAEFGHCRPPSVEPVRQRRQSAIHARRLREPASVTTVSAIGQAQ